jgi:hypothetical protein
MVIFEPVKNISLKAALTDHGQNQARGVGAGVVNGLGGRLHPRACGARLTDLVPIGYRMLGSIANRVLYTDNRYSDLTILRMTVQPRKRLDVLS